MIHIDFYIDLMAILKVFMWILLGGIVGAILLFNFIFKEK